MLWNLLKLIKVLFWMCRVTGLAFWINSLGRFKSTVNQWIDERGLWWEKQQVHMPSTWAANVDVAPSNQSTSPQRAQPIAGRTRVHDEAWTTRCTHRAVTGSLVLFREKPRKQTPCSDWNNNHCVLLMFINISWIWTQNRQT